jgi:hypothetical protein
MDVRLSPARRFVRVITWRLLIGFPLLFAALGCDLFHMSLTRTGGDPTVRSAITLPAKHQLRKGQFVFISDFEIQTDQPLFRELNDLRDQLVREVKLPQPAAPIRIYLFEDRERYERYMRMNYTDLPLRRAFFVAQPRGVGGGDDLLVYTFLGSHLRQDLRHELTHAVLHSVLKDVPLWLDEGLAEFFELPPEMKGVNRQHLIQLKHDGFTPDLARLEQLTQVHQMNPAEYREAWAWVHLMLRGSPEAKKVLLAYLHDLRKTDKPGPMQPRFKAAVPDPNDALRAHLAKL